jgi:hypothetical protein
MTLVRKARAIPASNLSLEQECVCGSVWDCGCVPGVSGR